MEFNLVTYLQSCSSFLSENRELGFLNFIYYSHIPTALTSLTLGLFIWLKTRGDLSSRLFFLTTLFFSLWSFFDIVLWTSLDSRVTMFFWSIINFFENMVSLFTLYFVYVFIEKKDVALKYKLFFSSLFLPFLILLPTHYNITGFNAALCEAQQGSLINYFYFLEGVFFLTLIGYGARKIWKTSGTARTQVAYLLIGSVLFLLSFSGANIAGSVASIIDPNNPDNWKILQYGLFGMPVFLGFLTYLIVKYQAFNVKLIGAQVLVIAQIILIGAMFFFVHDVTNRVLIAVTFVSTVAAGWFLVKSVQKEIKRKEELQEISHTLAVANERLKELDTAKSEFISIASHQLRTPLTAIRGYISLVLEGSYGKVAPSVQEVLNKVYLVNNRMGQLVEDLLSISRIESGRVQYNFVEAQLEPIVADVVDMFALIAKTKGLALKIKLPKKTLPLLRLDTGKIREVISNLVDNAIKYTKEGSVTVTVEALSGVAVVKVTDTGIGIDPNNAERLFEKFTRSSETMKLDVSGTGLGLYVGKNFVQAHGGLLSVESEGPGKGSSFIIKLPLSHK